MKEIRITGILLQFYSEGIVLNNNDEYILFIDRKRIKQIKCSTEIMPSPKNSSTPLEIYFKNRYVEVLLYD
jgi:hypothetical protein